MLVMQIKLSSESIGKYFSLTYLAMDVKVNKFKPWDLIN